jgi:hypothetical protein
MCRPILNLPDAVHLFSSAFHVCAVVRYLPSTVLVIAFSNTPLYYIFLPSSSCTALQLAVSYITLPIRLARTTSIV